LGFIDDNPNASKCIAKAKAGPYFRIRERALTDMFLVDMDNNRIESWHIRSNLQDDKEKEDGEDDAEDDKISLHPVDRRCCGQE
jgi:hypothetical protein